MPEQTNDDRAADPRLWGGLGVGFLAFAAYAFCATPTAYPLDSAELATAAFGLGVAHPPGEETTLLLAKLCTLLPLGSIAFKVALSQAAAGALAAVLVYLLVLAAAEKVALVRETTGPATRVLIAAAAALAFAYAPGVVIVSNRAEVYATQTALSLGALWLALRAHGEKDPRLACLAAMLVGFGVGNHSLIAGLVGLGAVAAALPMLVHSQARVRFVAWALAAFAAGLLVHAYIPLRTSALFAAADRGIDNVLWGDGRGPSGLWWVVSARTFTEKTGIVHDNASPADLPFLPLEELTLAFALIAPAGAYFLLRRSPSRVAGLALLLGALGSLIAALVGGLDPGNPDIRGYLGPAFALIAVCSGIAIAVGTALFRLRPLRLILAVVFLLGALTRFPSPARYPGLRGAQAADAEARALLADVPARGALFTQHFETGFLVGHQRFVEGARPDVLWAHLPFAPNPAYAERARAARPELAPVIDAYRARRGLDRAWAVLDRTHPVRIEPDPVTPPEVRSALAPAGRLWAPAGGTATRIWPPLSPAALAEATQDRQVRGYLAWRHYIDATWSCELGFRARARERFAALAKLVPGDVRFAELRKRCE
ncbi:MAG: DUF2723 domain-containing protein [Deltaproteobacteria bacterium]|nr:DUF2723 domain-containing protein [Deltaproteobacteria bacterium]